MSIYAYMVTKNEVGRYLLAALASLMDAVDGICVYDDRSTDDTADLLSDLRIPHIIRPVTAPSFQDNESAFRQDAWRRMESMFEPRPGDWIFSLDADEVLRTRDHLRVHAEEALNAGHDAVWMHVHEMWAPEQVRVDGFWGDIKALRFCEYKRNGFFLKKPMGGGSVPDFVNSAGTSTSVDLLHFGYFNPDEREPKMDRYLANVSHGHNPRHIRSIISAPTLALLSDLV